MENKEKTTTPEMPDIDVLFELADLFKVFGDSTQLRIMYTISENEMSVLNIAEALSMEQSTIISLTISTALIVQARLRLKLQKQTALRM